MPAQEIFPPPTDNVVVVICGPKGFVDEACLPLLKEMNYKNATCLMDGGKPMFLWYLGVWAYRFYTLNP